MKVQLECTNITLQKEVAAALHRCTGYKITLVDDSAGYDKTHYYVTIEEYKDGS